MENKLTLHRFYLDALMIHRANPSCRYGQALFNHLVAVRPDLAEQIRGTDNDPFYCVNIHDEKFDLFSRFIESH